MPGRGAKASGPATLGRHAVDTERWCFGKLPQASSHSKGQRHRIEYDLSDAAKEGLKPLIAISLRARSLGGSVSLPSRNRFNEITDIGLLLIELCLIDHNILSSQYLIARIKRHNWNAQGS
jgi:hypothetical protein